MFVPVPLITPFSLFGDQVMTIATMAHEPCDQHGYKLCGQHGCEPHSKHVANMIYVTPNIKRLMIDSLIISPLFVQGFHKHISIALRSGTCWKGAHEIWIYQTIWHIMDINLPYKIEKVNQGFKRYGNPDMPFLGTLKNKIWIWRFSTIKMKNLILLF